MDIDGESQASRLSICVAALNYISKVPTDILLIYKGLGHEVLGDFLSDPDPGL